MKFIIIVFTITILHGYCDAALEFSKCSINDSECQKDFFQHVGRTFAPIGIPAIGVPPLDPYHLENISVPVMDILTLKLVSGDCLGIGTCTVFKYETDLVNFHKIAEVICDRIVIQGSYEILSNPFISLLFGNVHGSGNGSIILEGWYFKFDYPFEFVKHNDGEIYIQINFEEAEWVSKVLKNVTIVADNIMVDCRDVTNAALDYINKHWMIILEAFGKYFHEISVGYYFEIYGKFFNSVPTSSYLSDDLTPYLKKDRQCSN